MPKKIDTGRNPTVKELREAKRIASLHNEQQRAHPSAIKSNPSKLTHINTYGALPHFYIDQPFQCVKCGKPEIWRALDQEWYYEEVKGHIDARAIHCQDSCPLLRGFWTDPPGTCRMTDVTPVIRFRSDQ